MTRMLAAAPIAAALSLLCGVGPSLAIAGESSAEARTQRGKASWYGKFHHGRRTASGEIFDANGFTAAHRSLPFGTRLRVTNEKNGRAVVVRVNDRGPHGGGRILDLSRAAAQAIGLTGVGTVLVARTVRAEAGTGAHPHAGPLMPPT